MLRSAGARLGSRTARSSIYSRTTATPQLCSLILVEDPKLKGDPRHADAVYFLAESLFQDGNGSAARIYFKRLVEAGRSKHLTPPFCG